MNSIGAKTALVLSGGGMFGAYQAGAWKALSREVSPEIVVGVSVGSLNGWCIAGGASPQDLIDYWLQPETAALMKRRIPLFPWGGIFNPQPLVRRARDLFQKYTPSVDFGVVVMEAPQFRPRLFHGKDVSPMHLVASCSVPLGFPPVRIGRRFYYDGGLLEALPLWAAAEMGAARVIAINALRFKQSPRVASFMRKARTFGPRSAGTPAGLELIALAPSVELGYFSEGAAWRRDNIRRWIDLGEADAVALLEAQSRGNGLPMISIMPPTG